MHICKLVCVMTKNEPVILIFWPDYQYWRKRLSHTNWSDTMESRSESCCQVWTYKMEHSSLWQHEVMTRHSILCPLPLDSKLEMCMARQDAGHVPSTGTLDQNTHHGSYPSGDSFGLARRRMPSEAGNYGCPLPVQNPPTKHSNKLGTKLTWKKKK